MKVVKNWNKAYYTIMITDYQLITRYLSGDEQALEILISRYLKPVYGFVFKYAGHKEEAEDIVQETFVKAWKNLKKFDGQKKFKTWLFQIAKNTALDYLKKKKSIPFSEFSQADGKNSLFETLADFRPLPDEIFESAGSEKNLNAVISKLARKYRRILELYYQQDLNFRQIAETINEPLNTVKSRHRRALKKLRELV